MLRYTRPPTTAPPDCAPRPLLATSLKDFTPKLQSPLPLKIQFIFIYRVSVTVKPEGASQKPSWIKEFFRADEVCVCVFLAGVNVTYMHPSVCYVTLHSNVNVITTQVGRTVNAAVSGSNLKAGKQALICLCPKARPTSVCTSHLLTHSLSLSHTHTMITVPVLQKYSSFPLHADPLMCFAGEATETAASKLTCLTICSPVTFDLFI